MLVCILMFGAPGHDVQQDYCTMPNFDKMQFNASFSYRVCIDTVIPVNTTSYYSLLWHL